MNVNAVRHRRRLWPFGIGGRCICGERHSLEGFAYLRERWMS